MERQSTEIKDSLIEEFIRYLNNLFEFYYEIKQIVLIHNDVLYKDNISFIRESKLINDTIQVIRDCKYRLDRCLQLDKNETSSNNQFIVLSEKFKRLTTNPLIREYYKEDEMNFNITKGMPTNFYDKKNYETIMLIKFIKSEFETRKARSIVEVGCGKVYQTKDLLNEFPHVKYFGIDKKEDLINKINNLKSKNLSGSKNKKKNQSVNLSQEEKVLERMNVLSFNVDELNFESIYSKHIEPKLSKGETLTLFGLHSCGNLTTDSIKIFCNTPKTLISQLFIVGCCINLLTEEAIINVEDQMELKHIFNLGFDCKGNYLDNTTKISLKNDLDRETFNSLYSMSLRSFCENQNEMLNSVESRYPLSAYLRQANNTGRIKAFLSRTGRYSSMSSVIGDIKIENNILSSKSSLYYKSKLFKSVLESLTTHTDLLKELSQFKGIFFVKDPVITKQTGFSIFLKDTLRDLSEVSNKQLKIVEERNRDFSPIEFSERIKKYLAEQEGDGKILSLESQIKNEIDSVWSQLITYEEHLFASYLIRLKFARIVEYIVAVDRVIYLLENPKVKQVDLIKIFDPRKSLRNLLISCSTDMR